MTKLRHLHGNTSVQVLSSAKLDGTGTSLHVSYSYKYSTVDFLWLLYQCWCLGLVSCIRMTVDSRLCLCNCVEPFASGRSFCTRDPSMLNWDNFTRRQNKDFTKLSLYLIGTCMGRELLSIPVGTVFEPGERLRTRKRRAASISKQKSAWSDNPTLVSQSPAPLGKFIGFNKIRRA